MVQIFLPEEANLVVKAIAEALEEVPATGVSVRADEISLEVRNDTLKGEVIAMLNLVRDKLAFIPSSIRNAVSSFLVY